MLLIPKTEITEPAAKDKIPVEFNNQYLNDYMKMVEDTESPRIYHIWSAISAISAALGRRCYFPFGPMVIYPNMYIMLIGNPGTRKSTAANMASSLLRDSTKVRFAPTDTGGQRQGLVTAMLGMGDRSQEFLNGVNLLENDTSLRSLTLDEISEITDEIPDDYAISLADKHHIKIVHREVTSFLGQNNLGMLDFLTQMYDGDDYDYGLKNSTVTLKNPLLGLLGCSTPVSIALSMPAAAGGQGFLSRVILVYGARKYKSVPRPKNPPAELVSRVKDTIATTFAERDGAFDETPDARAYSESLYDYPLDITDSRFGYYNERRYTHLIKLAMSLCAARGDSVICRDDYYEAHRILRATERGMPEALGQFGMNPLAQVKQMILETINETKIIEMAVLQAQFHREARSHEISEVINDLVKANQVRLSQGKSGQLTVHCVQRRENIDDTMLNLLAEI